MVVKEESERKLYNEKERYFKNSAKTRNIQRFYASYARTVGDSYDLVR